MITPELQAEFIAERPDLFLPVHGGWGRSGATHIRLALADEDTLHGALHTGWKLHVEKNNKPGSKPKTTASKSIMPAGPAARERARKL